MGIRDVGSTDIGYKTNTDGLLLYLDAGNLSSYPGVGREWYDISTKGHNTIPASSVSHSSVSSSFYFSGGQFSFDTFNVKELSSTNVATVELVWKPIVLGNGYLDIIFGFDKYMLVIGKLTNLIGYTTGGPGLGTDFYSTSSAALCQENQWYHIVAEMYTYPPTLTNVNRLWVDGNEVTLTWNGVTVNTGSQDFNFGNGRIASVFNVAYQNYTPTAYYSIFKIYNRTLSQQEITNNYNYYKTRYPIS